MKNLRGMNENALLITNQITYELDMRGVENYLPVIKKVKK